MTYALCLTHQGLPLFRGLQSTVASRTDPASVTPASWYDGTHTLPRARPIVPPTRMRLLSRVELSITRGLS